MNLFSLDGKVALVTGAASGLGADIASTFIELGAKVVLADINLDGCADLANKLAPRSEQCLPLYCDLADRESVESMADKALAWQGAIDILVCCGGIEGHVGSLTDVSDDDWDRLMTVNLKSANWLSAELIPSMAKRNLGRIIFISSIAGQRGNKAIGLYGIAKAGLSQMARNLAVECGASGITVNAIAPGLIETPLSSKLMADKAFMTRRMALTPLRRMGQPHEISGIAVMLASAAGGFITGQTLVADGGTMITDGN